MNCPSNICANDPEASLRSWYPNEEICRKSPREHWQKAQAKIHRLYLKGVFKYPDKYFMLKNLKRILRVTPQTKGIDPERKID